MTWRRSTAWEALGVAPAHPSEHGAAMSRATSGTAGASPPCASSWAQGLAGAPRSRPSVAARCEFGRASQGVRTVRAPCPGQSARGTAQRTIVPCRQMPRWRQARPRESRAPRGAPHTGRGTAAPRLRATPACGSSAPSCGSSQASATPPRRRRGPSTSRRARPASPPGRPCRHLPSCGPACRYRTARGTRPNRARGVLATISVEEPDFRRLSRRRRGSRRLRLRIRCRPR